MNTIQNETNIPRGRILELVRKKHISFEIINGSKHYDLNEINKIIHSISGNTIFLEKLITKIYERKH